MALPPGRARTLDQTERHRIGDRDKDDRHCARYLLEREHRRRRSRYDDVGIECNQLFGVLLHVCGIDPPAEIEPDIAALGPAEFVERFQQSGNPARRIGVAFGQIHEDADVSDAIVLLRAGGKRPRYRQAAGERDEIAPPHSITSSARVISDCGKVSPMAAAALRLTESVNLAGSCTGRSPGRVPRRMRST